MPPLYGRTYPDAGQPAGIRFVGQPSEESLSMCVQPSTREPSATESLRTHGRHVGTPPIDDGGVPRSHLITGIGLGDIRGIKHAYLQAPHIALSLHLINIVLLRVRNGNPDARTVGRGRFRTDEFPFTAGVNLPGPQDHVTASR